MDFCNQCHNMLYVKTKESKSDEKKLEYFCRTCNTIVDDKEVRTTVYKRNYTSDDREYKLTNNDYILDDPTLPRMNNIDCINNQCLSNQKGHIMCELDSKPSEDNINSYLNTVFTDVQYQYQLNENILHLSLDNIETESQSYLDKLVSNEDYEIVIQNKQFVDKPRKEVVFIKYDSNNMKFLYMCAICKTSWKNK